MRIHLDALGGMAGDMFVAAMLDAFPRHEAGLRDSIDAMGVPDLVCTLLDHNDGVFRGRRFDVRLGGDVAHAQTHAHAHPDHAHHDHAHRDHAHESHSHSGPAAAHAHAHACWRTIRERLHAAPLAEDVRRHALAIFGHLADAEARVHGVSPDDVAFHEVGAWDSIADVVASAHLIAAVDARWSVSALPLGAGRVATAHGLLPVPAPATVILLEGFGFVDDGVPGERVTPTGAAILRHICPPGAGANTSGAGRLGGSGVGFGTRRLPGVSNCVRALVFDDAAAPASPPHRELLVVEFEVDDQSPEDLATGLDRLRGHGDVFDVIQAPVFGKKGRMTVHVRLLARPGALDAVAGAVFAETTTIGLRHHRVEGLALPREARTVARGERQLRVKIVDREAGRTAKAESDDAKSLATHAARAALRHDAERAALAGEEDA